MMSVIELVIDVAGDFPVTELEHSGAGFGCTLTVSLPSGDRVAFNLEVQPGISNHVEVRERAPGQLPRRCPDRHITPKSLFCLNWISGDPQPIVDNDTARAWWASLWDYLTRQVTAGKIGRWPGPVRAHGKAVIYQDRAERSAAKLGEHVVEQVSEGGYATRLDQRRGRNRIELLQGGATVNRIQVFDRTLTNHRVPCICSQGIAAGVPIGDCGDHAPTLAAFIDAIHRWTEAEREYFNQLRRAGMKCCQTLHHCGLKQE